MNTHGAQHIVLYIKKSIVDFVGLSLCKPSQSANRVGIKTVLKSRHNDRSKLCTMVRRDLTELAFTFGFVVKIGLGASICPEAYTCVSFSYARVLGQGRVRWVVAALFS